MSLLFAVGDIHGSLAKLENLVAQCAEHAGERTMTFVFLGDYIDRGPDSRGVIRFLIDLRAALGGRVIALMGNHELMALAAIDGIMPAAHWLGEGGKATLQSYGVRRASELPREHVDWLRALQFAYDDGQRFFVHAGIDPKRPLDAQDQHDLVWMREPFLGDERDYGRLIVHGHTPVANGKPDLRRNRLNLDTAAVFGGPLTAAVFDDATTAPTTFLQAT